MLRGNERFRSTGSKRQILVAEDELINREILGEMLKGDYDILFACDGEETLEKMRENRDTLSLVLLDILMPVKTGLDVLREVKADDKLSGIPIIVTTAERETEVESLELGAIDFIPKPYPSIGVILARLRRTIELFEDRDIINDTERDSLTGLYNKEYFYSYAQQYDTHHPEVQTDAVIMDINHFRMLNERYGKAYGDVVLKQVANRVQSLVHEGGGIVCRREADTFMIYGPHREDYEEIMEKVATGLVGEDSGENRVRFRMGVYPNTDRSVEVEQRFDRAKMAADTVKGIYTRVIGYYDETLHQQQLYAEQLIEDFPAAIAENQFKVYYQPKFDIRPDTPVLASAEALVRWFHPTLGMISPGVFIPLFEENGLIQKMDEAVWKETARQIREWKDQLGYSVPISVNVSRIDLFDPDLPETLQEILDSYGLSGQDFLLEVTESAYTQDSEQIIKVVQKLRDMGFQIEMDDFGTGYSSLHMVSKLPIDAMKLDMQFIRNAFAEGGNTHMLEVIIGIADYLSVPVIAEGVETGDQMQALKILGCDIVQGYFFSKPVPANEFEAFILQRKEADYAAKQEKPGKEESRVDEKLRQTKLDLMRGKTDPDGKKEEDGTAEEVSEDGKDDKPSIRLRAVSILFSVLAFAAAIALMFADVSVTRGYQRMAQASDRYIEAQLAASELEAGSDYLTDRVRCFVVTGDIQYLKDFEEEVQVTKRRDKAVENLEVLLGGSDRSALESLNAALSLSNELVLVENKAMRLVIENGSYSAKDIPEDIASITLTAEEQAMTPEQRVDLAETLVFDSNYMDHKDRIRENVRSCTESLIRTSSEELQQSTSRLSVLVNLQTFLTIIFLFIVMGIILIIAIMIRAPLLKMVKKMENQEEAPVNGVEEIRFVARTYNRILEENREAKEKLSREASQDALTGLFNRGAYDLWMESTDTEHIALILIDVDHFKEVNDTYGHDVGDKVLKRVAEVLRGNFRSVDILCRIGGDEFAVVMTRVNSSLRQLVRNKIDRMNDILLHPKDDLPAVSLSVGVAFSDRENPQGDIFKDADTALYRVKDGGKSGCEIY
ncbi:MAG: EAL domain-containing protein [Oscillospiraceae bacterium]|nr:EAL domain-containing protein [Oscillospiraceae bacterium]